MIEQNCNRIAPKALSIFQPVFHSRSQQHGGGKV